jgi:hypothetical protein
MEKKCRMEIPFFRPISKNQFTACHLTEATMAPSI